MADSSRTTKVGAMNLSDTANVNGRCCFADGYNYAHCFYLIALCFLFCSGVTLGKQLQLKKHRIFLSVPICGDLFTLILIGQHETCAHFRGKPPFQSSRLTGKRRK